MPFSPLQFDPKLFEGQEAILWEKWIVSRGRIHSIQTTDKFLSAEFDVIPTRGFYGRAGPAIRIGSIWEYLSLHEDIWIAREHWPWRVFFGPPLIQEVLAVAESFPEDATLEAYDRHYDALILPLKRVVRPILDETEREELRVWQIDPQLADKFAESWVQILEFFQMALQTSQLKDQMIAFIERLRREGYDRKLRAGQSLFMFVVSRSRRHGLRPDQPSIIFTFHDGQMYTMINKWNEPSTWKVEPGTSDVEAALAELLKHPID